MQSVAMLVTLAAAGADEPRRRETVQHASDGIDALAALHGALVSGAVAPHTVRNLRDWTRRRLRPDDPELAAVLDEIELRILVELAKLER